VTYAVTIDGCDCGPELAEDGIGEYIQDEATACARWLARYHEAMAGGARYFAIHCIELGAVHVIGVVADGEHYPFPWLPRADLAPRRRRR